MEQVYLADDVPIVIGISNLNPAVTVKNPNSFKESVLTEGKKGKSLFKILEAHTDYSVEYAIAKVETIIAGRERAEMLEIEEMIPLVCLKEIHYSREGFPLIYSTDYIDTRRFTLNVVRKRRF